MDRFVLQPRDLNASFTQDPERRHVVQSNLTSNGLDSSVCLESVEAPEEERVTFKAREVNRIYRKSIFRLLVWTLSKLCISGPRVKSFRTRSDRTMTQTEEVLNSTLPCSSPSSEATCSPGGRWSDPGSPHLSRLQKISFTFRCDGEEVGPSLR